MEASMWRFKWILAFVLCLAITSMAQVKSVEGGAGRLVTRHTPTPPAAKASNESMGNPDVLDLVSLGLPDDIIIQKIQSAPATNFDTSVAGLKSLKAGKVSDAILRVMLNPKAVVASAPPATAPESSNLPKEIGVYAIIKSKLTEVEPEIVGWQTGGVLKSMATLGLDKGHINGKIMKSRSPLRITNPVEFVIRTPEGTSVTEYQLLSLYIKGNRREFRAMTGGILHATGGAERTAMDFKSEKIGERTWRIQLQNLSPGEYGFLPPGISSASISSSGKMYTFGVKE
jgi:hypothetical protein